MATVGFKGLTKLSGA